MEPKLPAAVVGGGASAQGSVGGGSDAFKTAWVSVGRWRRAWAEWDGGEGDGAEPSDPTAKADVLPDGVEAGGGEDGGDPGGRGVPDGAVARAGVRAGRGEFSAVPLSPRFRGEGVGVLEDGVPRPVALAGGSKRGLPKPELADRPGRRLVPAATSGWGVSSESAATRLLRREAGGQLPQERQKPMLVFFHTPNQSRSAPESEQTISEIGCIAGKPVANLPADDGSGHQTGENLPPDGGTR